MEKFAEITHLLQKMHVFKLWPKTSHFSQYIGHNAPKYSKRSNSERGLYNRTNTILTLWNHISMKQNSLMPIVYGQSIHIIRWNGPVDFSNSLFFNNSVGVFNSLRPQIIDIKMQTLEHRLHSFPTIRDM